MQVLRITPAGTLLYATEDGGGAVYLAQIDPAAGRIVSPFRRAARELAQPHGRPSYSWDGKYLAYTRRAGTRSTVHLENLQSGEVREITPKTMFVYGVEWGTDDSTVLADGWDDRFGAGLYLLNLDNGENTLLVRGVVYNHALWTPDGKAVIYSTDKGTFRVEVATNKISEISSTPLTLRSSRSGKRSLVASRDLKTKSTTIDEVNSRGEARRRIVTLGDNANPLTVAWIDDETILATERSASGDLHLLLIEAATGQKKDLGPSGSKGLVQLRISPDGRRLAASDQQRHGEFWSIDNLLPKMAAGR